MTQREHERNVHKSKQGKGTREAELEAQYLGLEERVPVTIVQL